MVLWDLVDGKEYFREKDPLPGVGGSPSRGAYSRDGRNVASARFMFVALRDAVDGPTRWKLDLGEGVSITGLAFADEKTLIVGTSEALVIVDAVTGRVIRRHPVPDGVVSLWVSPDGKRCATGGRSGLLPVWDLDAIRR